MIVLYRAYLGEMRNGPAYYWAATEGDAISGALKLQGEYDPPMELLPAIEKIEINGCVELCRLLNIQQENFEIGRHSDLLSGSLLP